MSRQHEFDLAVRYYETDAQGFVHHANYFKYFELARLEQLRESGHEYADLEQTGIMLVVSEIRCRFHAPSRFGDTLRMWVQLERVRGARIHHRYRLTRDGALIAEGESTVACVNREGRVQRIPDYLTFD